MSVEIKPKRGRGRPPGSKNKKPKAAKPKPAPKTKVRAKRKNKPGAGRPSKYGYKPGIEPIVEDTPIHDPTEHFYGETMPDAPSKMVAKLAGEAKAIHFVKSLSALCDSLEMFVESLQRANMILSKMDNKRK